MNKVLALEALEALAEEAYIFTLPLVVMNHTRWMALVNAQGKNRGTLNQFVHGKKRVNPRSRHVTTPNHDTLYSSAWLDLSEGPLVVEVPDTDGRYYSLQFMDAYTNSHAAIGRRKTGTGAGRFLIAGPDGEGENPDGLPLVTIPTQTAWVLARWLVDGPEDIPAVNKLQEGLVLTGLDGQPATLEAEASWIHPDPSDPWNYLKTAARMLAENPPPESHLVEKFKALGLAEEYFHPQKLSAEEQAAVIKGMENGKAALKKRKGLGMAGKNGWSVPEKKLGQYGTDYLLRASTAILGLGALEPEEALYYWGMRDHKGKAMTGAQHYTLSFSRENLPPVDAFWSLTLYQVEPDMRLFFFPNPMERYAIGDRSSKREADGSLVIHIGHRPPENDVEANWLPAPEGPFTLVFRAYQPAKEMIEGTYQLPPLKREN